MLSFHAERRAGLDCGATGARLVLAARRRGALQVEDIFIEDIPFELRVRGKARPPLDDARRLLLHKSLSGRHIVFVAPGASDSCFIILPKMSKAEADSAMLLQAKKLLGWEVEAPIMAHVGSEFARDRVGSLVGLADWRALKPWCRLMETSGCLVDDVTLAACAYQALAAFQRWADEFPVVLLADLGATASMFYILDGSRVRFMRKVPVGGDALTRVLTTTISTESGPLQLNEGEAEEVKITGYLPLAGKQAPDASRAAPPAGQGGTAVPRKLEQMEVLVRPLVERLAAEIMRSIQFYKDNVGQNPAAIFLTGGGAGLRSLLAHLQAAAGLPVRLIDPFAGLAFASPGARNYAEKNQNRLAMAVGLALATKPSICLLPRFLQVLKRFAALMPRAVAVLLAVGFVPLLLAGISNEVKIRAIRSELRGYQEQIRKADRERQQMEALQAQLQESAAYRLALGSMVGHNPLWAGVLNALAAALPPEIALTRFCAGSDPGRPELLVIEGKVLPAASGFDEAMAALLPALSSSVFFKQVNIMNARAERSDNSLGQFEIHCLWVQ